MHASQQTEQLESGEAAAAARDVSWAGIAIDVVLLGIAVGTTWLLSESWQLCTIVGVQLLVVGGFVWRIGGTTPGTWLLRSVFGISAPVAQSDDAVSREEVRAALEEQGFEAHRQDAMWHSTESLQPAPPQAPYPAHPHGQPAAVAAPTAPPTASPTVLPSPVADDAAAAEPIEFEGRYRGDERHRADDAVRPQPAAMRPGPAPHPRGGAPLFSLAGDDAHGTVAETQADTSSPATDDADEPVEIPAAPQQLVLADGSEVPLSGVLLVGRKPRGDADETLVTIDDEKRSISRSHLRIETLEHAVIVTDLGSANGTTLRRDAAELRLEAESPVALLPGDRVVIGRFTLTLR